MFWSLHIPHLVQAAMLVVITGPAGIVVGAVVGGVLGFSAGRGTQALSNRKERRGKSG